MGHSDKRSNARIVAWVDLILTILGIIAVIVIGVFGTVQTVAVKQVANQQGISDEHRKSFDSAANTGIIILWVFAALVILISFVQLWAVINLMKATEEGKEGQEAFRRAKKWKIVTIVFLVLSSISYIGSSNWGGLVVTLLIRGIFLWVVHNFTKEIEGSD